MLRHKIAAFRSNTLLANSFYLLFASGAVAAFGFIFWAVVARSFADSEVGIAATLLSLSSLISLLSLAGFDTTFVRFLPKSDRQEDYINSGLIITAGLSVVLSIVIVGLFPLLAPELAFVTHNFFYAASFVLLNMFATLNTLTNSIFLAYRKAIYILVINVLFSVVKVALPFIVTSAGAMTIFIIAGLAQVVGVVLSFWVMARRFRHNFLLQVHIDILRLSRRYSFAVYGSSILNLLPPTLLPLIITRQVGPAFSAYYYMAFTIATILYTVAYSSMQSVLAESSHAEEELRSHLKKAARLLVRLMLPTIIALMLLAPYILGIFGGSYSDEGTRLLQIFAASAVLVGVYSALGTVFKIKHATRALIGMNIAYCTVIVGMSYLFMVPYGLTAVGTAWFMGNLLAIITGLAIYKFEAYGARGRGAGKG